MQQVLCDYSDYTGIADMKKIALIDDDKKVCEVLQTLLEEDGFQVRTAHDGITGLEVIREYMPDLIICDVIMKKMNGFELLSQLMGDSTTSTIPFIFLTAKAEKEDLRKGLSMGADDFLFKPFRYEELVQSVNIRLKKNEDLRASLINNPGNYNSDLVRQYDVNDKIIINSTSKPQLIKIGEIKYICSQNQYSSVAMTDGKTSIIRKSVSQWEKQLPEKSFLRIHRSAIVNLEFISKIEKLSSSSFLISLTGERNPFIVSRRYAAKIRSIFF